MLGRGVDGHLVRALREREAVHLPAALCGAHGEAQADAVALRLVVEAERAHLLRVRVKVRVKD